MIKKIVAATLIIVLSIAQPHLFSAKHRSCIKTPALQMAVEVFESEIRSKEVPLVFTLASTNILEEELYQHFSRPQKSGMAWHIREKIWLKALFDNQQLANADLICMQEFNSNQQEAAIGYLEGLHYGGYFSANKTVPSTWFKETRFYALGGQYYPFKTPGAQTNGFSIVFLTPKMQVKPVLGIINAHLKNDTPADTSYEQFRVSQIEEILDRINNSRIECFNWIICGDFNTDRRTHAQIMQVLVKAGFVDAHAHQPATARSSQGHLKSIDYMWFVGPDLGLISTDIYPAAQRLQDMLLNHRETDKQGIFFSDHAILKARFVLGGE